MDLIQEVFVVLENRPGAIGELSRILKKKNISVYAIGVFQDTARFYLSDSEKAKAAFKENGYEVDAVDVLRVILPNRKGALMELSMKLGNAGINIEHLYGAMEKQQKKGTVILAVDKTQLAIDIFESHKF